MTFVRTALEFAYRYFEQPWAILIFIPIIIILYFILRKRFVKIKEDKDVIAQKKKLQIVLFFTRALIIILLLIALANYAVFLLVIEVLRLSTISLSNPIECVL